VRDLNDSTGLCVSQFFFLYIQAYFQPLGLHYSELPYMALLTMIGVFSLD